MAGLLDRRLNKFIAGEDELKDGKIPLEAILAYIQTAESDSVE
jgi:hypothetical protein